MKSDFYAKHQTVTLTFFIILFIPALFYQTTLAMAEVWWVNETFTHGFLVFPIALWLIWNRKDYLFELSPRPEPAVFLTTLFFSCLWLISALTDVKAVMQISMISIILTLIWTILGRKIFFFLLFPLLFLYLAVPLGQGLIPYLMEFTANTTVQLIRLTGTPVYQDGLNFVLPSGSWSVVEECSGVRYLIATITLGIVYSYLTYASLKKRLIFIAFTIVVPVIANSMRAFIIVMLGHLSGMKLAVGADHILYGWVFFGIIIFTMFYIGSFWRDHQSVFDKERPVADTRKQNSHTTGYLTASFIVIALFPLGFHHLQANDVNTNPITSMPLHENFGPWQNQPGVTSNWQPILTNPDLTSSNVYSAGDDRVQLDIGFYLSQREGSEAVSRSNALVDPYGETWKIVSSSKYSTADSTVQETTISYAQTKLLTWQWYRIGESRTHSPYIAKLYEAYLRIFSGRSDGAYITLSTPVNEDINTARTRLLSFYNHSVDAIDQQLDRLYNEY